MSVLSISCAEAPGKGITHDKMELYEAGEPRRPDNHLPLFVRAYKDHPLVRRLPVKAGRLRLFEGIEEPVGFGSPTPVSPGLGVRTRKYDLQPDI